MLVLDSGLLPSFLAPQLSSDALSFGTFQVKSEVRRQNFEDIRVVMLLRHRAQSPLNTWIAAISQHTDVPFRERTVRSSGPMSTI